MGEMCVYVQIINCQHFASSGLCFFKHCLNKSELQISVYQQYCPMRGPNTQRVSAPALNSHLCGGEKKKSPANHQRFYIFFPSIPHPSVQSQFAQIFHSLSLCGQYVDWRCCQDPAGDIECYQICPPMMESQTRPLFDLLLNKYN